ncbi:MULTISPECIES: Lrp/AsnC family transcriptional regulator [unclassified Halorhabdus]|uniref:Lrp/AsnC family transcriptional regulator n=1 Tax=unclassified Halorhabdus TaxID=2621901 RepID=UPI0023DB0E88|nr:MULTISPECIES: Lrp/AsnC family transcriptional regulator [unclassified Halorhabdus]WEL18012.1 DNA-binding transcriptional regulator, Lrp family [Halorhabdus sp. SVX81]WEL21894.1 DNA-binding transcriptional regulator, Lrp family [Halorhabdus sp. BNX81]
MAAHELDDLDRAILYALQDNARKTSTSTIAERMDVAPSTVRTRIQALEADGILTGYHAEIDYEQTGLQLHTLIVCTAPVPDREELAERAQEVSGVVAVREVMTGHENVHIEAIGRDGDDLNRIGRELDEIGLTIEDEDLIRNEYETPFDGFSVERA